MTEGTDKHKGAAYAVAVEELGATISASLDYETITLELVAPIDRLEPALELMAEAILRPSFSGGDLDRLIKERMGGIMQEYANAPARATIAFRKAIFTPDSLYARSEMGEYWSVAQLAKGKVKKYFENFATPATSTLIVAGDLEGFPVAKLAEKLFGGWKGKEPKRSEPQVRDAVARPFVLVVDKEEAKQSYLQIGHVGLPRSTPDYFAVSLLSAAVGGSPTARLNLKVREELGYTYGIFGGFQFRRAPGLFNIQSAVQTKVTVDAIAAVLDVLKDVRENGISQEELDSVKGYLSGLHILRFETPQGIADGIESLVKFGLPDDYFDTYRANVADVTLDEVNEAAQKHLSENIAIVVVGDSEVIRDGLLDADFGPVAVRHDPDIGEPPSE